MRAFRNSRMGSSGSSRRLGFGPDSRRQSARQGEVLNTHRDHQTWPKIQQQCSARALAPCASLGASRQPACWELETVPQSPPPIPHRFCIQTARPKCASANHKVAVPLPSLLVPAPRQPQSQPQPQPPTPHPPSLHPTSNHNLPLLFLQIRSSIALLSTRPQLSVYAGIKTDALLTMRHPLSFLPACLLLSIAVSVEAFVVPWSRSDGAQFSPTQRHHSAEQQQPYKSRNVLPNLTWLRDFAIEKVFRVPKLVKAGSDRPASLPHPFSTELPNTLLAKYGGDVVLRFNLSTPAEEKALAEAADTLFLDVWEFTQNWADIRLREDDVRRVVSNVQSTILIMF